MEVMMRRRLAIAAAVIATLGSVAEIGSFAMQNGSFLIGLLTPEKARVPIVAPSDPCAQERNLFVQKLCIDKESRKQNIKP
jgi:hypothetical protein